MRQQGSISAHILCYILDMVYMVLHKLKDIIVNHLIQSPKGQAVGGTPLIKKFLLDEVVLSFTLITCH